MMDSWTPKRILWSWRKARLPISSGDLVLDVGSGSNPHPSADVLLEKFVDPAHRYDPLVADRPTVLADACKMPFRDKAFDFVIAFHVLEHMEAPARFLNEVQRVGKAGYIEAPNALFERLVPYDVHLLEIMDIDGKLLIHKKSSARPDSFLNGLNLVTKSQKWRRFFYGNPDLFHVRHTWKDRIQFEVLNPETPSDWFVQPAIDSQGEIDTKIPVGNLRSLGLSILRRWHRMTKRRTVNLRGLLVCPECRGELLFERDAVACPNCNLSYPSSPLPDFNRGIVRASRPQAC
jgi:SAM-dependent methyltransferase